MRGTSIAQIRRTLPAIEALDPQIAMLFYETYVKCVHTHKMSQNIKNICVYCGSQPGTSPSFKMAADAIGASMVAHGLNLVYGGGTRGIMGQVANACLQNGGHVTGIIPEFLLEKEASREGLSHLSDVIVTKDMHARKHLMFEKSDAFITLPGGIGTLEELTEMMTWAQLGRHNKPIVIANVDNFWHPLQELFDHMSAQGFIHTQHLVKPIVIDDPRDIIPHLLAS